MRYRVSPEALSTVLRDGAVVLNLETKRYYSLNETGTRVWQLLGENAAPTEIVAVLSREYEVDEAEAQRTTDALLDELVHERLLVVAERR